MRDCPCPSERNFVHHIAPVCFPVLYGLYVCASVWVRPSVHQTNVIQHCPAVSEWVPCLFLVSDASSRLCTPCVCACVAPYVLKWQVSSHSDLIPVRSLHPVPPCLSFCHLREKRGEKRFYEDANLDSKVGLKNVGMFLGSAIMWKAAVLGHRVLLIKHILFVLWALLSVCSGLCNTLCGRKPLRKGLSNERCYWVALWEMYCRIQYFWKLTHASDQKSGYLGLFFVSNFYLDDILLLV